MQAGAAIVSLRRLTMFLTLEDRQDEVAAFLSLPVDMQDTRVSVNIGSFHNSMHGCGI